KFFRHTAKARVALQSLPKRALAVMGELKKAILADPAKRAFENGSKRKVVLGLKQRIRQREQVHDGEFIDERHPVRPCDWYALAFQSSLKKACHRLALAQQDQDISGLNCALAGGEALSTSKPVLDLRGDSRRQQLSRLGGGGRLVIGLPDRTLVLWFAAL